MGQASYDFRPGLRDTGRTMGEGREFLDKIYALENDGDVRSFYDQAAEDYDDILLARVGYVSPTICAQTVAQFLADRQTPLIDLGCGTGLAGEALAALGYSHIDGVETIVDPEKYAAFLAKAD